MKRESYLMVDHRASPGVPEDFYRNIGFNMPAVPEGTMLEAAVLVCLHCQQHAIMNPRRTRERGYCPKCDGYICDICSLNARAADYVHRPFKKLVDDVMTSTAHSQADAHLVLPPILK
jgi:Zn-finger nucleic acid-binding protein